MSFVTLKGFEFRILQALIDKLQIKPHKDNKFYRLYGVLFIKAKKHNYTKIKTYKILTTFVVIGFRRICFLVCR